MSLNMRGGLAVVGGLVLGRFMVAPHDISLSANVVNENSSIGLVFSTATASDVNSNEVFTWSLLDSAGGKFAIHPTNGNLSVNGSLDFETASSHNITVQVTDKDGLIYNEIFTINVSNINEPPVDINISSNQSWGMTANSTVIGTATATDPDAGDISTWDFTSNPGGYYAIHPTNGQITKAVKYAPAGLNSITIRATDTVANTYTEAFNIDNAYLRFETGFTEAAGNATDAWGRFFAIDDDCDTMVIGAYQDNTLGTNAGRAYIYTRSGSTWSKQATLTPSSPRALTTDDFYGFGVAMSGDGDTAVVCAHRFDNPNPENGRIFIWKRNAGIWTNTQTFGSPDGSFSNDAYGFQAAMTRDGSRLLVSEVSSFDGVSQVFGKIHIYTRPNSSSNYSYSSTLSSTSPQANDTFGHNIEMTPDGNTLIVAAPYRDTPTADAGIAYIYAWNGSSYILQATINDPNPTANGLFSAWGVNISGDGNTTIVTKYSENSNAGVVYFYTRTAGVWSGTPTQIIKSVSPVAGDAYGYGVVLNGDGTIAIIGSLNEDISSVGDAGAAYLFSRSGSTWTQRHKFTSQVLATGGNYGSKSLFSFDEKYAVISCHGLGQRRIEVFRTGL